MKKLFEFKTKTIVATGLGAALFTLLFMYVKIPTGIPETDIQTAYGIGAFFAALFGPIAGGLIAFIGHALSDGIQYGYRSTASGCRSLCRAGKPGRDTGRRSCYQQCDFCRRHRFDPAGTLQQDTFQEGQPDKGINQYKRTAAGRQDLQAAVPSLFTHYSSNSFE